MTSKKINKKRKFNDIDDSCLKLDIRDVDLPTKVTVNFTAISDWIEIRKQNLIIMLINLIDSPMNGIDFKVKCLGFGPSIINLRFYK